MVNSKEHNFRDKLVLNQWLVNLFGIDPFAHNELNGRSVRPFHMLADVIKRHSSEGLNNDNLHFFYHSLVASNLLNSEQCDFSKDQVLSYDQNIVRHTQAINKKRRRPVVWKYYQWLTLLFVEIYLERYFCNREMLRSDLNAFIKRFNSYWPDKVDVPPYGEDDLNKICLQNATGSGKTLIMHVNLLQFRKYATQYGKNKDLSRVILLTPNERLSEQHVSEFRASDISTGSYLQFRGGLFDVARGLEHVDVLEITKLVEQEGPNTIATRSLGDQNLLLVDEGHRGIRSKEEGAWFARRSELCAKGFTFEYSATFEQAVRASGDSNIENIYAKSVIFDYSYRWFYEDGFGKDYRILNLPKSFEDTQFVYLTACLLKYYQQLRIYEENIKEFDSFHLEKPLWVFVGNTVSSGKMNNTENLVATDVALIIKFVAKFLDDRQTTMQRMQEIIFGSGQKTGLLDKDDYDIFTGAFSYLTQAVKKGESIEDLYRDLQHRLFNHAAGGHLSLNRVKGVSGEVALRVGTSETPFGLINVGDAKSLCDHVAEVLGQSGINLTIEDSEFYDSMFTSVKDSTSPVNLLIGSKKFIEGWDCWRVSTMGLMHVGQSEGSQIIQLFGRGVRLKGYDWSLKRSGHSKPPVCPTFIEELETLNVFGIKANFMEKFREYLKEEGLPGNERHKTITIPLNVTYDFGKKLLILRPKRKASDGKEYEFKKDAPVPAIIEVSENITRKKIKANWYPRIQAMQSTGLSASIQTKKSENSLQEQHLALLDFDEIFFELERYKCERSWYNLNITKDGIRKLLKNPNWYTLYLPESHLYPDKVSGVFLLQQVATELLKRYCESYYNLCKREFIEPRLELRELTEKDENIPKEEFYQLFVDSDEEQLVQAIEQIKEVLELGEGELPNVDDLQICNFGTHLFEPLLHTRSGGKISNRPVALNESEYQFVIDLKEWNDHNKSALEKEGAELYLLRNMSRGKGVGFFEAGNFHPDFILWVLFQGKQYVTFVEPHGLMHEGSASDKILFYERIKDIEKRLNTSNVILNCFILSWTPYSNLKNWGKTQDELEDMHVLFMKEDREKYIYKLFDKIFDDSDRDLIVNVLNQQLDKF